MQDNKELLRFFNARTWQASIERFPLSGYALVDRVNALRPRFVVDVGCGFNPFKGKIPNLIGIDIANDGADLQCDLHDAPFADAAIDVCLALGSINFGDRAAILAALRKVHAWLKPGGSLFMRANPGEPIGAAITVFPWDEESVAQFASELGFAVNGPVQEERLVLSNGVPARRLVWVYVKQ
ncbi:class I SAM-dependent methyltransferase [Massilia atriviolacea]|uniref:Class I SAM-dependent methyltransferase n=1 Tax=Massilia atriviolacea TaxID=2495579 RepID=A0A430HN19_9BURK|nr:class I SAM-dependent methyltransferase [Massilia atriviolacea]RSZ58874.1 class I SAM-dependent methyltransferase [Massilia atriviolacea]